LPFAFCILGHRVISMSVVGKNELAYEKSHLIIELEVQNKSKEKLQKLLKDDQHSYDQFP
jgi:hypothetical protein